MKFADIEEHSEHDNHERRNYQERRSVSPEQVRIGWNDKTVSIVGIHSMVVVVLICALGWMGYLLNRSAEGTIQAINTSISEQTEQQTKEHNQITHDLNRNFDVMSNSQSRIAESMEAQTFLLTKTEKERSFYKMDIPEGLRRRIR